MHPPKQKNTTVEQSLRSDTSNSRSSEYILYWYTTRFNLAVWRGSLVEAKYTDLYKFSRLSKTPARSTLFQVDFDIVMYVNYNILYLRSCIYYCMYLSIGVAMGNRDFSCTSKKVGLEYSLRLYLWQIFLILDCLVSMSCCASFPMPDIDAGEGSPSDKLELDVFIMDCLGFWMLLECSRPLEIRNCFPPNERTFARRPVSGSNCFTKRTAIVLFQFNSNRFFPEFWRQCTLPLSLSIFPRYGIEHVKFPNVQFPSGCFMLFQPKFMEHPRAAWPKASPHFQTKIQCGVVHWCSAHQD